MRRQRVCLQVTVLALALPVTAAAQSGGGAGKVRISPPVSAAAGEHLLLCAASVGGGHLTADILDGVTGIVLKTKPLTLARLGGAEISDAASIAEPPDPCLEMIVPPSTVDVSTTLFIGRVTLNPQPLPPGIVASSLDPRPLPPGIVAPFLNPQPLPPGIVASLQIFSGTALTPANVRIVMLPPDPCFSALGRSVCSDGTR